MRYALTIILRGIVALLTVGYLVLLMFTLYFLN